MIHIQVVILLILLFVAFLGGTGYATYQDFLERNMWRERARTATHRAVRLEKELNSMERSGAKDLHKVLVEADKHGFWAGMRKFRKLHRKRSGCDK